VVAEPVDKYAWLDDIVRRIALVYHDDFTLVPVSREHVVHPTHGNCQCFTYKFVFRKSASKRLPNEDGPRLMRLISQSAKIAKASPTLVPTRKNGKHDFGDWGWVDKETAHMWIFLDAEKCRENSDFTKTG